MACRSAVKLPKRRTRSRVCGDTSASQASGGAAPGGVAPGGTEPSGTQTHSSAAPTSMPAACGCRVLRRASAAGSVLGGLRRGMASSRMRRASKARTRAMAASGVKGSRHERVTADQHAGSGRGRGGCRQSCERDRRRTADTARRRHQRGGRKLPDPDFATGTRLQRTNGYRDPLPAVRITEALVPRRWRPR